MPPDGSLAKPNIYADPYRLQVGPIMIEFRTVVVAPSGNKATVDFLKPFANNNVTVVCMEGDITQPAAMILDRGATTNKSFSVWVTNNTVLRIEYIAIGQTP